MMVQCTNYYYSFEELINLANAGKACAHVSPTIQEAIQQCDAFEKLMHKYGYYCKRKEREIRTTNGGYIKFTSIALVEAGALLGISDIEPITPTTEADHKS